MNTRRFEQCLRLVLALAVPVVICALVGCGRTPKSADTTAKLATAAATVTAKRAYAIAQSALSTVAPDGKLLLGQSTPPIIPTPTRDWEFLIGSPKNDELYAVNVKDGSAQFEEYGAARFSASQWAAVPSLDDWKVDSDAALAKALTVHKEGKAAEYFMGFVTYEPTSTPTSQSRFLKWVITFDSRLQGTAPTSTVIVDMATGEAAYAQ